MTPEDLALAFERQRSQLLKVAENIVGNAATAEEVVQDAFVQIYEGGQWKTSVRDLDRWFTTTVQNVSKNRLKAERRRIEHEASFVARQRGPRSVADVELGVDMRDALNALPADVRSAVLAVVVDGQTEAEYAESVGLTQQAVNKKVSRGKKLLRRLLNAPSALSQSRSDDEEEAA